MSSWKSNSLARRTAHRFQPVRSAFTLIELLLVLVILAILAGVVVNKFGGIQERAKDARAKTDLANISNALDQFKIVNGEYPTADQGLEALVNKPNGDYPDWKQCLDKIPTDPWNHPYIYKIPGTGDKPFDLICAGPDGREGGGDDITK